MGTLGTTLGTTLVIAGVLSCGAKATSSTATDTPDGSVQPDAATDAGTPPSSSPDAPYRITCGFYYRPPSAPAHDKLEVIYFTDQPREANLETPLDNIPIRTRLTNAVDDSGAVILTIELPRSQITREFRLSRTQRSTFEFVGFHGFTGLNYITTPDSTVDLQFICETSARDEAPTSSKPIGSSGPLPSGSEAIIPKRIRCEGSVDDRPREKIEIVEETTKLEGTIGDVFLGYHNERGFDGPSSGLILRRERLLQVLFQLNPHDSVRDPTLGEMGFTGKTTIVTTNPIAGTDGGVEMTPPRRTTMGCTTRF